MYINLFRLAGIVIIIGVLRPVVAIPFIFIYGISDGAIGATFLQIAQIILLLISGIAVFLHKRWSVITLWASLAIALGVSIFLGHYIPSYFGNTPMWFIDFVIAIWLTIEVRKNK
jgi:hypothetical protein